MGKRIVIVGGVAGGATAAARARRLDETAEITIFERGNYVSFANCGLPYHISGEIAERDSLLVQTVEGLGTRFALDIRTRTEVTEIDRDAKRVFARELNSGREFSQPYDVLILAPGAAPLVPPIPGVEHQAIYTLRNMEDMDRIKAKVDDDARTAVVVGGGFVGLETAENLKRRGLDVAIVELTSQVMPPFDPEIAAGLHQALVSQDIQLFLDNGVVGFEDHDGLVRTTLKDGATLETDLVVLAAGVRPESNLAKAAGLNVSERGGIVVDDHMQTSDPAIYAVGDAVQVRDCVLDCDTMLPLAGPANRQARIAADHIFGRDSKYPGVRGTSIVRLFDTTAAMTGASEKTLKRRGIDYRKVYVHRGQHVGYFPGAQMMMIKLLFSPDDGKILGAQIVGGEGVDKRVDVLATAMQAGWSVDELEHCELAYSPQYGAAKDPINIAGNVAMNLLREEENFVFAETCGPDSRGQMTIVDVRESIEFDAGHIDGAVLMPLSEIRRRWKEIRTDKPICVYCGVGQRAYYATRVLRHFGLKPTNLAGGLATYRLVHQKLPKPRVLSPSCAHVGEVFDEEAASVDTLGTGETGCCQGG